MSKYDFLWAHIQQDGRAQFKLTFDEIAQIAGLPLDHSFLTYKKRDACLWLPCGQDIDERADGGI